MRFDKVGPQVAVYDQDPMRRCPTMQSLQRGAGELETNCSVPQQEEQTDGTGGKVIADYDSNVDYEPEGSDPKIDKVDEEVENSYAE